MPPNIAYACRGGEVKSEQLTHSYLNYAFATASFADGSGRTSLWWQTPAYELIASFIGGLDRALL